MEVTEIEKTYSEKVQLQQYEPVEISMTQKAVIHEGDDPEDVAQLLHESNKKQVQSEIAQRLQEK